MQATDVFYPLPIKAVAVLGLKLGWFTTSSTCEPAENQFAFPWLAMLKEARQYVTVHVSYVAAFL